MLPRAASGHGLAAKAFAFVLLIGVVNFFADTTYEGASGINGPFLRSLGASALAIGVISGVGEFLGYALRWVSGAIADRTGRRWLITFAGYAVNLLAVPALALAHQLGLAAVLVVAERVGRAFRKPTIEGMLSHATGVLGKGWVFALNNALDQAGATVGPLVMALVLVRHGSFRTGYATLLVSAVLALVTLTIARLFFPKPSQLQREETTLESERYPRAYVLFTAAGACVAAGLVSFELISFHFSKAGTVKGEWIPIFFAIAMGTNAVAGLVFGKLFDRIGVAMVVIAFFVSAMFSPFVFFGGFHVALVGMILWGIGFGAQDTLLKSLLSGVIPKGKRNRAFGMFYLGYGGGWLVGSVMTGLLYERSRPMLVAFSMAMQLVALPIFMLGGRAEKLAQRGETAHR
jgi:MFS family permease